MPKIINAFRGTSPVANSISQLGLALFGDQVGADLKREQLLAAQRENAEAVNQGTMVRDLGGTDKALASPDFQGSLIASGRATQPVLDLGRNSAFITDSPIAEKFALGAGQSASSLPSSFATDQANQNLRAENTLAETATHNRATEGIQDRAREDENTRFFGTPKPVLLPSGQPGFVTQQNMTDPGVQPIRSETEVKAGLLDNQFNYLTPEEQKQVLGANQNIGTSRVLRTPTGNYIVTDESYSRGLDSQGNVLPAPTREDVVGNIEDTGTGVLTNAGQTNAQESIIAGQKFGFVLDQAEAIANSPNADQLFGVQGKVRAMGQEVLQGIQGLSALAPKAVPEVQSAQTALKNAGLANVLPELYDPRLPAVETLGALMLYQGAAVLAGQSNRSVSDKDILMMRQIIGDPQSIFSSRQNFLAKAAQLRQLQKGFNAIDQRALGGDLTAPVASWPAPNSPAAGVPGVGNISTPPPAATEVWERGPDGVPRRVQ